MEEKERYEVADFELGEPSVIFDNEIQQFEEKNKKLDKRGAKNFDAYMKCSKKYTKLLDENLQLKQTQRTFAIDELVKLRKKFFDLFLFSTFNVLSPIIDNQIKELGGWRE